MTKFEEELMATAKMIPTSDGNEIKFKTSSALYDYLLVSNGEAELYLESQLQQQALPVVPECVAEFIKKHKGKKSILGVLNKIYNYRNGCPKIYDWVFHNEENEELFALAFITGKYEIEKPQLFYLKNKIELEDVGSDLIGYLNLFLTNGGYLTNNINRAKKFTQQEIDSMNTGSYELIEVTE